MEVYVACFDIGDDRLRERVGKVLVGYGDRVQKSVFEIAVEESGGLEEIRSRIMDLVEEDDNIRFYRLCAACRTGSSTLSGDPVAQFPAVVIV